MKNITTQISKSITKVLLTAFLFAAFALTATDTFAQTRDTGGSADGSCLTYPSPSLFKRNNGQGTCGGDAQIRLYFNERPTVVPTLMAIYYNGEQVAGVLVPIEGDISTFDKKGYVSYCISGTNIPPAHKLTLQFHFANSCQEDILIAD